MVDLKQESKRPTISCIEEIKENNDGQEAEEIMNGYRYKCSPKVVAVPVSNIPRIAQHYGTAMHWILG